MPARTVMRMISGTHELWYRLSGGRIGGRLGHLPILLLTTTGRRSGRRLTTPLVYLPDGENLVIIASNGGAGRHPEWWVHLPAPPHTEGQGGPPTKAGGASKTQGGRRERPWQAGGGLYHGYDEYR